jgi:hypothetical protein
MRLVAARLRAGEWGILAGSLALAASLASGHRRGGSGAAEPAPAPRASSALTCAGGLLAAGLQAGCRGPAAPVAATIMLLPVSSANGLLVLASFARGAFGDSRRGAGAWLGLAGALAVPAAAYRSLREDGIRPQDGPEEIELVALGGVTPS